MAPTDRRSRPRCQAEAVLRAACRTLLGTSPELVTAFTISLRKGEYGATLDEWRDIAQELAEQFELQIEISMPRDDLRVRFRRYVERESGAA